MFDRLFCYQIGHVTQACGSPVLAMSNLNNSNNMPTSPTGSDDMRYQHGTELVMLYDYKVSLFSRHCMLYTISLGANASYNNTAVLLFVVNFLSFLKNRRKLLTICRCVGVTGSTPIWIIKQLTDGSGHLHQSRESTVSFRKLTPVHQPWLACNIYSTSKKILSRFLFFSSCRSLTP